MSGLRLVATPMGERVGLSPWQLTCDALSRLYALRERGLLGDDEFSACALEAFKAYFEATRDGS